MIINIIMIIIFLVPLYGFFIWVFIKPKDSVLLGRRWMYQEEPEVSRNATRYMRFASIVVMVGTPIVIYSLFLDPRIFGLVLVLFILTFIIGALIIITGENNK